MYPRTLAKTIHTVSASFPVLMVTGPRQVGKTTLLEMCAQDTPNAPRRYVTLDDLDARALAQSDPALFLQTWPAPVIIDEVQYAPQLFSAIKRQVDREKTNGPPPCRFSPTRFIRRLGLAALAGLGGAADKRYSLAWVGRRINAIRSGSPVRKNSS